MSYKVLAAKSAALSAKYPTKKTEEDEAWEGSPFDWIRKKASATKGKIGRDFAGSLVDSAGFNFTKVGYGLEVNGKTIRVRTSLMWGAGSFAFEQIRDSDFEFLLCLGLYPDSAFGWLIPKNELIDGGTPQEREGLSGQHGGKAETGDFWLTNVDPSNVYAWLAPYGGTADALVNVMKKTL